MTATHSPSREDWTSLLVERDKLRKDKEELVRALERIASLDAARDSSDGWNEWGEADCFRQSQMIANKALKGKP